MTDATFNFLVDTLVEEVRMHPYRDELLALSLQQLEEDTYEVQRPTASAAR